MEGVKFGKWTAIKKVVGPRRGLHFECRCECGYVKVIGASVLRKGLSSQCYFCRKVAVITIGERFGKWQVLSQSEQKTSWGARRYECKCECGAVRIISVGDLRSGKSTQCTSCHISEKNTSHSLSKISTYRIWAGIRQRCFNPRHKDYAVYGGRGIIVCESWQNFENFIKDMGVKPDGLEIDRIDVDGNYEPGNCRWVTRKENVANRRMSATNRDKYILVNRNRLCANCVSKTTCRDAL